MHTCMKIPWVHVWCSSNRLIIRIIERQTDLDIGRTDGWKNCVFPYHRDWKRHGVVDTCSIHWKASEIVIALWYSNCYLILFFSFWNQPFIFYIIKIMLRSWRSRSRYLSHHYKSSNSSEAMNCKVRMLYNLFAWFRSVQRLYQDRIRSLICIRLWNTPVSCPGVRTVALFDDQCACVDLVGAQALAALEPSPWHCNSTAVGFEVHTCIICI